MNEAKRAQFHLPGLFEFYDFYRVFLPLYRTHREYFYDWCEIASIYGAPEGCLWGGGRVGCGNQDPHAVLALTQEYGLSARLTFSNSLLTKAHLADSVCNALCRLFSEADGPQNGVIVHSDLLLDYLRAAYPQFYFISSTTKVLTDFPQLRQELEREAFRFVVPDFRLNKAFGQLLTLPQPLKGKVEFLCNECCWFGCKDRKACYEAVSRKKSRRACTAPLYCAGFSEWLPFFPGNGKPRLSQRPRYSNSLSSPGFFQLQAGRPRSWQRHDSRVSALLSDKTGLSAARARGDLSGCDAGLVLASVVIAARRISVEGRQFLSALPVCQKTIVFLFCVGFPRLA